MTFRQRPDNHKKAHNIIRDIETLYPSNSFSSQSNQEKEIKQINDLYDKRKNVLIPKATTTKDKDIGQGHSIDKEHKQTEFQRPTNYIVYGERQRAENNAKIKEYEATYSDKSAIEKLGVPISEEVFEKIIISLENDIGVGEMCPKEYSITQIGNFLKESNDKDQIYTVRLHFKICY